MSDLIKVSPPDIKVWAQEFVRAAAELPWKPGSKEFEEWARTWFEEAIMAGYEAAARRFGVDTQSLTGVIPPLVFDGTTLSIPRATATQDGYLAKEDFAAFAAGGPGVGVTQITAGTGLETDTGDPITGSGTLRMATIPGVEGTYSFTDPIITVNAQGQITSIISGAPDLTAPNISTISITALNPTSATINWITDDSSDSQVEYGTVMGGPYGTTPVNPSPATIHAVPLSSLLANTIYYFRVISRNFATPPLSTTSDEFSFTTPAVIDTTAPGISGVGYTGLDDTSVTINWTTNELADSQVLFGPTTAYSDPMSPHPVPPQDTAPRLLSHSVNLTGLSPGTPYHYHVKSRDAAGNVGDSLTTVGDQTFTTLSSGPVIDLLGGLVSYWKMDTHTGDLITGSTPDEVGNNDLQIHVAVAGAFTFPTSELGLGNEVCAAGNATASDQAYLSAPDDPSQHFAGSFSIAGWVSIHVSDGIQLHTVLAKDNAALGAQRAWALWYNEYINKWEFVATADGTTGISATIAMAPVINTPYFLVGVYDAVNHELRISLNNAPPVTVSFPGTIYNSSQPLAVIYPVGRISNCSVDEVGLWAKALSTDEITALWNGSSGKTHPFT